MTNNSISPVEHFLFNASKDPLCMITFNDPIDANLPVPKKAKLITEETSTIDANKAFISFLGRKSKSRLKNLTLSEVIQSKQLKKLATKFIHENYQIEDYALTLFSKTNEKKHILISMLGTEENDHLVRILAKTTPVDSGESPQLPIRANSERVLNDSIALEDQVQEYRDKLRLRVRQLTFVSELGLDALSGSDSRHIMNKAVEELHKILEVDYAKVLELLPGGEHMVLRAGVGWHKEIKIDESTVDTGFNSQAGFTLSSKHPVIVDDLRKEKRFTGPPLLNKHKVVSGMSCIIHGEKGPYGVLGIHSTMRRNFSEDDIDFLQSIANIIAMSVQHKSSESELRESEQRFRQVASLAPVLIWMSDKNKQYYYLNKPWLEYTGRTLEQEYGFGWADGVHEDDYKRTLDVYKSYFNKQKSFTVEFRLRRYDGSYRWVINTGIPRFANDGEFLGFIGSCIDIHELKSTKRRKMELEQLNANLKDQRAQLVSLNNSKDEFISIASHQLRTPATAVKQYLGLLVEGYAGQLEKFQESLIHKAFESNERQINIIEDLLKVARIDNSQVALNYKKTDIGSLILEVAEDHLKNAESKQQKIKIISPSNSPYVYIDYTKIRMAIENLVDNAIKYSPSNTVVEMKIADHDSYVRIDVSDEGFGIDEKDYSRVFQKFSRLSPGGLNNVDGTGLGLYLVKKIVVLHGGSLDIESKRNEGTTFCMKLPKIKSTTAMLSKTNANLTN